MQRVRARVDGIEIKRVRVKRAVGAAGCAGSRVSQVPLAAASQQAPPAVRSGTKMQCSTAALRQQVAAPAVRVR